MVNFRGGRMSVVNCRVVNCPGGKLSSGKLSEHELYHIVIRYSWNKKRLSTALDETRMYNLILNLNY